MRNPITVLLSCVAVMIATPVAAEVQPVCRAMLKDQPFSIVVANGPGGGYDTYARSMAPSFEALFGVQVRVENLVAAGGLAAYRRLIEARPGEWVVLLDDARDVVEGMQNEVLGENAASRYRLASVFHLEPSVWVTRPGFDLSAPDGERLVVGTSQNDDRAEMLAMANALLLPTTVIDGYDGSASIGLGLMAGEVDLMSVSLGTARRLTKAGELDIAAVLSDGPWAEATDLSYLLGAGGLLERRLMAVSGADADRVRMLGGMIVGLATVARAVVVPTALTGENAACLDQAINTVLADPGFHAAAAAEGRPVNTPSPADADAALARMLEALAAFDAIAASLTLSP